MNDSLEILAEGRRRLRTSAPSVTDAQWAAWLADVAARGGSVVLTLDGARAEYPRENAPACHQCAGIDQSK